MKLLPHKAPHFHYAGQVAGLFGVKIIVFWHVTPWGLAALYERFWTPYPRSSNSQNNRHWNSKYPK
jgi:hypothetical protein